MLHKTPRQVGGPRFTINHLRAEPSESVWVLTHASKIMKQETHLLIPHTSNQSGDTHTIEVPMTWIPVDLSLNAPKDELVRNPEFLRQVQNGVLQLLPEEEALAMLEQPGAEEEMERLEAMRLRRMQGVQRDEENKEEFKTVFPKEHLPGVANPGDVDHNLKGISPAVVDIMTNQEISDTSRLAMLKNRAQQGLLSDVDRRWIRANTHDQDVRNAVA